ncbi:SCP2 sterol-binding domain-containing protein [Streptomyces sp. AGS-58]|uniref:SCP2 sterol-binding domain-containing protein n=1 Tax=unclassified Streptomyces TaxID=2593676 RepID=UPI0035A3867F
MMESHARSFEELRKLVGGGSPEDAAARAQEAFGSPDAALDALFALYQGAFVPQRASGAAGEFRFDVATSAGTRQYTVSVGDGRCRIRRGADTSPTAVTTISLGDLLLLSTGLATGFELSAQRRLRTEGDVVTAIRFKDWFDLG